MCSIRTFGQNDGAAVIYGIENLKIKTHRPSFMSIKSNDQLTEHSTHLIRIFQM